MGQASEYARAMARARWAATSAADRSKLARARVARRWAKAAEEPDAYTPAELLEALRQSIRGRPGWEIHDRRLEAIATWLEC